MAAAPNLNDLNLPEVVSRFSYESAGLIVFAGANGSGNASAYAMAEHVGSAAGRKVTAISSATATTPVTTAIGRRSAAGYGELARAIREESAVDGAAILVEARFSPDILREIVSASGGGLVIATMDSDRQYPYVELIDLIWAAEDEDGGFRRDFEAALYAVVTQKIVDTGSGKVLETHVHPGSRIR